MLRRRREVFDEFHALEREMELAFEEAFRPMWDIKSKSLEPLAYLKETEDKVIITVDLPLVKKKDIKINLVDNVLEVDATMQRCIKFQRWGTIQRQCEFESFYKAIKLPSGVNTDQIKAKFEKGILIIEVPKKTKQYRIEIK